MESLQKVWFKQGLARKGILIAGILLLMLSLPTTSQVTITISGSSVVPYGSSIEDRYLDGVIGSEWSDATSFTTRIGGTKFGKTYRINVYMKHDVKYWYIAIVKRGSFFGGNPTAWICFDADEDGRLYEKGDDGIILPLTGGNLATDIDYAYVKYGEVPKRDTAVNGTDDKVGAGKRAGYEYVYEMKIDTTSGDQGSLGNDILLWPGKGISTIFGLMNDRYDLPSREKKPIMDEPEKHSSTCIQERHSAGLGCSPEEAALPGGIVSHCVREWGKGRNRFKQGCWLKCIKIRIGFTYIYKYRFKCGPALGD